VKRLLAGFAVAAVLGSPVLACAAVLTERQAEEHGCCQKKPQPEPKCCLLNPAATTEPASKDSAASIAPAFASPGPGQKIVAMTAPLSQSQRAVTDPLYLLSRSLRL